MKTYNIKTEKRNVNVRACDRNDACFNAGIKKEEKILHIKLI